MGEQQRLVYPDICKFVAIIIVTCSHCAQCISGEIWTNFLVGSTIDIAFTMPLFMLLSGWFLNLDKLRSANNTKYIMAKFKRLMIPAMSWYIIYCILTKNNPSFNETLLFYWYLTSLFICLCLILFFSKIIKSDIQCAILSTFFILACPHSDYANINFMFPYLWAGYFLHKILDSNKSCIINSIVLCSLIIGILLSLFWTPNQSVYKCPLIILEINKSMILTYIYRFTTGLCLSVIILYLIKRFESVRIVFVFAKYGQYSLAIYTLSFVFNGILSIVLYHFNKHINKFFVIDLLSIITCTCIIAVTIQICKISRKNKVTRLLLLGE